ncbi:hypothetical protein FRC04_002380 [Tulasnella sp. 424]|nr:hypothetical protein FRC04_002380 [Tulasnella sp. 424]KAG8968351.1 hypothetical protein FRC05_001575 [Tulasnella sp. 425]
MAQSRCQRLINAIAMAPTPALRGEAINKETFYLNLPEEPTKPITDPLWTDIRTSRFGEVLLSIVTNSNNPLSDGEAHFRISSLQVLHYITGTMEWDSAGSLEIQLRNKVFKLNEQLQRLEAYRFTKSSDLPMARAFAVFIMSPIIESARYDKPFLNALLQNKGPLLRTLYAAIFNPAHVAAIGTSADPGLVQKALVIFSILSDNFETDNKEAKNAISLYRARTIVDRFASMLQNPLYSDTKLSGMLSGMSALLHHLWSERSIIAPMVTQGRVHVHMMTSFWAYQSQRLEDSAGLSPSGYAGYCFRSDMVE